MQLPTKNDMRKYFGPMIWTLTLLFLFFMDTSKESGSFCLFKLIGFKSCLGCGIGHAIHHVLHLNFQQSFHEHILGIPATIGILYNIFHSFVLQNKTTHHGPTTNAYDAA
jgi:hypothetical protein